ncbi:MAG: hypothetical protein ACOYJI_02660 [Anaerovoracaceae bacterium]
MDRDVFRRHDNCDCNVDYVCEKNKQNVWSKKWRERRVEEKNSRVASDKKASNQLLLEDKQAKERRIAADKAFREEQKIRKTSNMMGAYTDDNDPYFKKRDAAAERLYKEISNRKKKYEVAAISKNTGIDEEDVGRAYEHLFKRKHLFKDGTVKKFDSDYYMAISWQRLREGKNIQEHDLILLKHEIAEEKIMGDKLEIPYEKAHNEVNKKYNYAVALHKYLKNHDA